MSATINISLPKSMYEDAKRVLTRRGYTSISELVRDALRDVLYPKVTENGFTPEFEEAVLHSAAQPKSRDRVWRGKGSFTDFVLKKKRSKS